MNKFSEKSLLSLGDYYVYGLIDPRNNRIFYIGKGTGNRVFEHERESISAPDSEKLKLKTISEIKSMGLDVVKIIINSNLTEAEAFAAEASLINAFNYTSDIKLTNIVAGHHSSAALSVEDFESIHGAIELSEDDIIILDNAISLISTDEEASYEEEDAIDALVKYDLVKYS